MLGWFSDEAVRASRSKRCSVRESVATSSGRNFKATRRPSLRSSALYTSPMPPPPDDLQHAVVRDFLAKQRWDLLHLYGVPPPLLGRRIVQRYVRRRRVEAIHGNHQPVSTPCDSFDVRWIARGIIQRLPKLLDRGMNAVIELHHRVVWPKLPLDLVQSHHFARTLH